MFLFENPLSLREPVSTMVFLLSGQASSALWNEMVWVCVGVGVRVGVGGWGDAFHPVPEKPRSSLCFELILMFVSDIFLLSFLKIGIEFWLFLGVIVSVFRTWLLLSQLSSRRTLL